jgi:N-methylhydantoinase A/oxoprolinase/acetone carboxylase beta subunit
VKQIDGPAILEEYDSTTFVAPGWSASVDGDRLELRRER